MMTSFSVQNPSLHQIYSKKQQPVQFAATIKNPSHIDFYKKAAVGDVIELKFDTLEQLAAAKFQASALQEQAERTINWDEFPTKEPFTLTGSVQV